MSKYTTEVRFICETEAGLSESVGYNDTNTVIQQAIPNIFNFNFPIFDESYRNVLETKILKHYYTQEIGLETYGLWKLKLDTKLNEIMPYYNKLYESINLEFNPLYTVDYTESHEGTKNENGNGSRNVSVDNSGNSSQNETTTGNTTNRFSDTPQGTIADVNIDNNAYLTNVTIDNGTNTRNQTTNFSDESSTDETTTNTVNTTDEYVKHIVGKSSGESYGKLISEYRESLINVDMMVINELSELFMNLW